MQHSCLISLYFSSLKKESILKIGMKVITCICAHVMFNTVITLKMNETVCSERIHLMIILKSKQVCVYEMFIK